ncbi:hypothetical protein D3C75_1023180 [compost metagenome]
MENGVGVETFAAVLEEVFNSFRRFIIKSFDYDIAVISMKSNHAVHPIFSQTVFRQTVPPHKVVVIA